MTNMEEITYIAKIAHNNNISFDAARNIYDNAHGSDPIETVHRPNTLTCACGRLFKANHGNAKHCSNACREKADRESHKLYEKKLFAERPRKKRGGKEPIKIDLKIFAKHYNACEPDVKIAKACGVCPMLIFQRRKEWGLPRVINNGGKPIPHL